MTAAEREALTDAMTVIAARAGALIMTHYEGDIAVRRKDDASPVTVADEEAERLILDELRRAAPGVPIVSEEAAAAGQWPEVGAVFFLVDPLDGTKEFVNRNGEFTVNVALIENGEAVAGVVYAPALKRMFYASGPGKAFEASCDPHEGAAPRIANRRPIAARKAPAAGLTAVASRSHRDAKTEEYLNHYNVAEFRSAGSSLKFCLVAAGEADIYPRHGRTMEWDTAAGHAVVTAAGGSVTRLDGAPLTYGKKADGFANPFFVARGRA